MKTNNIWKSVALLSLLIVVLISCTKKSDEQSLLEKAAKIHAEALTIDTHEDTPLHLKRDTTFALDQLHDGHKKGSGKVDFPRMDKGGLDAAFFIVWTAQGDRNPEANQKVKEKALSIYDVIIKNVNKYQKLAELAYSTDDVYRIVNEGKHAIQSPSYTAAVRGGPTKVDVIVDDDPILFPRATKIDMMLSFQQKAFNTFASKIALLISPSVIVPSSLSSLSTTIANFTAPLSIISNASFIVEFIVNFISFMLFITLFPLIT